MVVSVAYLYPPVKDKHTSDSMMQSTKQFISLRDRTPLLCTQAIKLVRVIESCSCEANQDATFNYCAFTKDVFSSL